MIVSRSPDVVVDIGDAADLSSLVGFEAGGKSAKFEGYRELWRDFEAYFDAQDRLMREVARMSETPALFKTQGNHEDRVYRALVHTQILQGFLSMDALREREYGWKVSPPGVRIHLHGATFCHNFPGSSSVTGPRGVVTKEPVSAIRVYGHTHRYGVYVYGDQKKSAACNVGLYADLDDPTFRYARDARLRWSPGVFEFTVDADLGFASHRFTSLEEVRKLWG